MDAFQYIINIIVGVAVAIILYFQRKSYKEIAKKIAGIKILFPSDDMTNFINCDDKDNNTITIEREDAEGDFKDTLDDINKYLSKNGNKMFDYRIIKEIVERNVQSLENEVDTILSTPLYLGLMATIGCIAFGVVCCAWKFSQDNDNFRVIEFLLIDVGIAMIASFCGILITTLSTKKFNDARTQMTKNKNVFLTWIQSDLMSKMDDNITGTILRMTDKLNEFNSTFAENTRELKETLGTVNSNYKEQINILKELKEINITAIAKANIDVYEKLQGCTDKLDNLFKILSNSESYLTKVIELNDKISDIDNRTNVFENVGNFFMNEISYYVADRQGYIRRQISSLDSTLQSALSDLNKNLYRGIDELTPVFQTQNQKIQELIESEQEGLITLLGDQQRAVQDKIGQIENPFAGIKEIFDEGLRGINEAFNAQTKAINAQNEAINEVLKKQTEMLAKSLEDQQNTLIQKFTESPSTLESLPVIADTLKGISTKLDSTVKPKKTKQDQGQQNIESRSTSRLSLIDRIKLKIKKQQDEKQ